MHIKLPFKLETPLEHEIAMNPGWQKGVVWGMPRAGHLEGPVMYHIADVLANIDKDCPTIDERSKLRLIALIHDTFKYRVDESRPRIGSNHHAHIARLFAEKYISDVVLLDIIELHDEAYHGWRLGHYKGKWHHAEERLEHLIERLGTAFSLYARFFYADSNTESKNPEPMIWFEQYLHRKGLAVPHCS
jgi:hypothetical protein